MNENCIMKYVSKSIALQQIGYYSILWLQWLYKVNKSKPFSENNDKTHMILISKFSMQCYDFETKDHE